MSSVLKGNISSYIVQQSAILMLGVIMLGSFILVDVYFISQLGSQALTAVSYTTPIVSLIVSMLLGLGAGIVVVLSNVVGTQDPQKLRAYLLSAFSLALLTGTVLMMACRIGGRALFEAIGAKSEVLTSILDYFNVLSGSVFFLSMLVYTTSVARSLGNNALLTYAMATLVAINAILDPILIFGYLGFPPLGISGAAWATTVAVFVSMWVPVPFMYRRLKGVVRMWRISHFLRWRYILSLALPIVLANGLVPLGNIFFVRLLSSFGDAAVAAYGAGSRIDMLVIFAFTSVTAVLVPFVGQNLGAGQYDRARAGTRFSFGFVLTMGGVAACVTALFGHDVSLLFAKQTATHRALTEYLLVVPWGYAFNGLVMISLALLNVYQKPWWATSLAVFHLFGIYLPFAYGATLSQSYIGILLAYPVSHLVASAASFVLLSRLTSSKMVMEVSG